jgi:hypothetical protein
MQAKRINPILNVSDIVESFAWFEKFGFTKGFNWTTQSQTIQAGWALLPTSWQDWPCGAIRPMKLPMLMRAT